MQGTLPLNTQAMFLHNFEFNVFSEARKDKEGDPNCRFAMKMADCCFLPVTPSCDNSSLDNEVSNYPTFAIEIKVYFVITIGNCRQLMNFCHRLWLTGMQE